MYSFGESAYAGIVGNFREDLGNVQGISKQFLDDVDEIMKTYKDDAFVIATLDTMVS